MVEFCAIFSRRTRFPPITGWRRRNAAPLPSTCKMLMTSQKPSRLSCFRPCANLRQRRARNYQWHGGACDATCYFQIGYSIQDPRCPRMPAYRVNNECKRVIGFQRSFMTVFTVLVVPEYETARVLRPISLPRRGPAPTSMCSTTPTLLCVRSIPAPAPVWLSTPVEAGFRNQGGSFGRCRSVTSGLLEIGRRR